MRTPITRFRIYEFSPNSSHRQSHALLNESGSPIAQFGLAAMYELGRGVDGSRSESQNRPEAAKWFRMAAGGGYKDAWKRVSTSPFPPPPDGVACETRCFWPGDCYRTYKNGIKLRFIAKQRKIQHRNARSGRRAPADTEPAPTVTLGDSHNLLRASRKPAQDKSA